MTVIGAGMLSRRGNGPLVIPMTLWRQDSHAEITSSLRRVDPDLIQARLTATADTLRERIANRPEAAATHVWCLSHLDACLVVSVVPSLGPEIVTDGRTHAGVAATLLALIPTAS